ncbi:MAG: hypothetical protein ACLGH0_02290 [Thermoanaerobaculia bacterium]
MPIVLAPYNLTSQEIRVLQEFRRLNAETLTAEQVKAIRHPAGGGEAPAAALAEKGFLTSGECGYTITPKGKEFLAIEAAPRIEETSDAAASAAGNPDADGV